MNSELSLNYRFVVNSPDDAHHARAMSDLMESSLNPLVLECVPGSAPYSGRLQVRASGNIGFLEAQFDSPAGSNTHFINERSRSNIARNHSFEFHLCIWLGGECRASTFGRTYAVHAGDFTVSSTDAPFGVQALDQGHGCTLALPASWDRIGDTKLENTFGNLYSGRNRHHNDVVNYARHLLTRPNTLALPDADEKLYDVIALALDPRAKSAHRNGLLALIHNHIYCASPDIAPANVAAAFDISVRYLHQLFAASDTSFTEYLVEQRLTQARRMLADQSQLQKTILSIAFECGFRDINHFGRRFRARYDATPGDFRRKPSNVYPCSSVTN